MLYLRTSRNLLLLTLAGVVAALPAALVDPFGWTIGEFDLGGPAAAPVGIVGEPVPWLLLMLVVGIGAVVAAYAARNLVGHVRLLRFAVLEVVAVLALSSAVVAPSLLQLAVGWTVGGQAVARLVGHAPTPAARRSQRVVATRLLLGDVALWAAVAVSASQLGTLRLDALPAAVSSASGGTVTLIALLVVVAGTTRSALVPAHRWLPETAEAPSPVSALLHAGLVNGVGVLGLLLWPVVAASTTARAVLLGLSVTTALLGTAQMRTRPDLKGRLAASTTAQMGYLGVQVALGLPAAVLAHLVGHGMWKASLFLGAGGAIERARHGVALSRVARRRRSAGRVAVAVAVAGCASIVPGPWGAPLPVGPAATLPVALAALALGAALLGAQGLGRRASLAVTGGAVFAVVSYLLGLRALTTAVDPLFVTATPEWGQAGAVLVSILMLGLFALGGAFWWLDRRARAGGARRVIDSVAVTSMAPRTMREVADRTGIPPLARMTLTGFEPPAEQVERTRALLLAACRVTSPAWPLESFVASNPLVSLEDLEFHDALEMAARTWGSASGPSADLFGRALEAGRIDEEAFVGVCARFLDGRPPLTSAISVVDVVRALVLHEEAPQPPRRQKASGYVDLLLARVYADPAWPTAAGGVWAAARADNALGSGLGDRGARDLALALPADPLSAVTVMLGQSGLGPEQHVALLCRLLTDGAGWAAHVAWRLRQGVPLPLATLAKGDDARADAYADLVSVRMLSALTRREDHTPLTTPAIIEPATVLHRLGIDGPEIDEHDRGELASLVKAVVAYGIPRLRLEAWEAAVRRPLVQVVKTRAGELASGDGDISASAGSPGGPDAQVVFCIDVRSERLRRHLESLGPWETYGAAGFFGLPMRHISPAGAVSERCPVLLRPDRTVRETASPRRWSWSTTTASDALHAVDSRPFSPFTLAEGAGWVLGPLTALRTAAPAWWSHRAAEVQRAAGAPTRGTLAVSASARTIAPVRQSGGPGLGEGFAASELVDLTEAFLRSTGLVELAAVVVLCGHEGAATNNPHLAAYDCGACGGRSGEVSARAMVAALCDPDVISGLLTRGIDVRGTEFIAAVHDTTRDRVCVIDVDVAAGSTLARLVPDLEMAADAVARERATDLPQAPRTASATRLRRHLDRRASDWAQVRPEWGLAGNTAMVVGPRSLTAGSNLEGRVFLQSYRCDIDPDGRLLEALMAGPLVVAQWINTAYWCSTVDPERFGAGDKTTHNVVIGTDGPQAPLSGVLTGSRGDLRIGLPWQAVSEHAPVQGRWTGLPQHDPVRLLALICAPLATVDAVLGRQPHLGRLVLGGWIALQVIDPTTGQLHRHDPQHGWVADPTPTRSTPLDNQTEIGPGDDQRQRPDWTRAPGGRGQDG